MKRFLLSFLYLLTACIELPAQQVNNLYYDNRLSMLFGSIEEQHSNYYVSGVTTFTITDSTYYTKALFGKINGDGNLNYIVGVFDSVNHHYSIFMNCLKKTADGNFIATGDLDDTIPKAFLLKIDTSGNVLLWHEYTYPQVGLFHGHDVIEIEGAGYLIAINAGFNNGNSDVIIIRTDTLGDTINIKEYGLVGPKEWPWIIRPMLNGHYMVGAMMMSPGSQFWSHTWFIELDNMGNMTNQWLDSDATSLWPQGMQQTADSGWIIARQHCAYNIPFVQLYNASLIKLDKNFHKEWEVTRGDSDFDTGLYDVEILPDGKYIACGMTPTWGHDSAYRWGWIVKIDTDGTVLWDRKYVALARYGTQNFLYDIDVLPNGDLLACGKLQFSYDVGIRPMQQGWLLRTDSNGCEIENCLMGIDVEQPLNNLQVQASPNPFTTTLSISLQKENLQQADFTITNIIGQPVYTKHDSNLSSTYTKTLELSYLPAGVYFLEVIAGGERSIRQLIKQ